MPLTAGELYVLGELDHRTHTPTPFVKIGIVRENDTRDTTRRIAEHQTGNPRQIVRLGVVATPNVERVETTMHGLYAPVGVGGEWFELTGDHLEATLRRAEQLAATMRVAQSSLMAAESLGKQESVDHAVAADSTVLDVHRRLLESRALKTAITAAASQVKSALSAAHATGLDVERFVVVQSRQTPPSFDKDAFQEQHPELHAQFLASKRRLAQRFTPTSDKSLDLSVERLSPAVAELKQHIDTLAPQARSDAERAHDMHRLYLTLLTHEAAVLLDDDLLEAELKAACGDAAGIAGVCSWKREWKVDTKLDETALKRDHADLYASFLVEREAVTAINVARNRRYLW